MALSIFAAMGFLFVFFVPGFLLSFLVFSKMRALDRFLLGFGLSLAVVAVIAFILGTEAFGITGGYSAFNVWMSLLIVSGIVGIAVLFQRR
jgi:uncharacterized membrane protein